MMLTWAGAVSSAMPVRLPLGLCGRRIGLSCPFFILALCAPVELWRDEGE